MKEFSVQQYKCELCGMVYDNRPAAVDCESQPITQDKGVKVGDIILITRGDGAGSYGKVTKIVVFERSWGHYAWKRYWHTIGLTADVVGSYGTRLLTFDDYETTEGKI